jgi:hypothetical protein
MLDDAIVAIGSANDCDILVEKFSQSESLSFADFARVWKASHFELIFWYVEKFEDRTIIFALLTFGFDIFNYTFITKSFLM